MSDQFNEIEQRLRSHVSELADVIGERNLDVPENLERAAKYLEMQWMEQGYEALRQTYEVQGSPCSNVWIAKRSSLPKAEVVLIGAHYDSISGSPGANDNGSGVAVMLELSRYAARKSFSKSILFAGFVNEEPPYFKTKAMGSRNFARYLAEKKERVKAMIALETLGYYSNKDHSQSAPALLKPFYPHQANFVAIVGNLASTSLVNHIKNTLRGACFPAEGLAAPSAVPGVDWSDHAEFWSYGIPSVMLTDTAPYRYPFYHTSKDTQEHLDFSSLAKLTCAMKNVIDSLAS